MPGKDAAEADEAEAMDSFGDLVSKSNFNCCRVCADILKRFLEVTRTGTNL